MISEPTLSSGADKKIVSLFICISRYFSEVFTGHHDPIRGSGRVGTSCESHGPGLVGSGQEVFKALTAQIRRPFARLGPTRPARFYPTRETSLMFFITLSPLTAAGSRSTADVILYADALPGFHLTLLVLLVVQSRFGDKPVKCQVVCPLNGTAVLTGLRGCPPSISKGIRTSLVGNIRTAWSSY